MPQSVSNLPKWKKDKFLIVTFLVSQKKIHNVYLSLSLFQLFIVILNIFIPC